MLRIFESVDRFTVGTVGQPGDRTFYLQFRTLNSVISTSIEKSQVAAISERLKFMLKEIRLVHPLSPKPSLLRDSLPLDMPVMDEFRVGSIAIFYNEGKNAIQVDLRELQINDDFGDDSDAESDFESLPLLENVEVLRIFITPSQAASFHDRAELVIAAGRQPCPFCGFPINPEGHLCARANGYRR